MNVKQLANYLAKRDKKKSEGKVGDKREDTKHLSELAFDEGDLAQTEDGKTVGVIFPKDTTFFNLYQNGRRISVK